MEVHNHSRTHKKKTTHTSTPTFYRPYSTWEKKIKTRNKLVIQSPLIIKFCSAWDKVRHGGREGKPPPAICKHGEKDGCRLIIDSTQLPCKYIFHMLQPRSQTAISLRKSMSGQSVYNFAKTSDDLGILCYALSVCKVRDKRRKKIWKIHLGIDESSLG